jgi:hypothetical protein
VSAAHTPIPISIADEDIERQIERAEENGDARLLSIAYLRRFVRDAEAVEGRTNRYYSVVLEGLVREFGERNRS